MPAAEFLQREQPAEAPHPGAVLAEPAPAPVGGQVGADVAELTCLVELAAGLDLDDQVAVTRLRALGHRVTSRLAAAGALPAHLVVELDAPAVVAVRTLALAARRRGQ